VAKTVAETLTPIREYLKGRPVPPRNNTHIYGGIEVREEPRENVTRMCNLRFDLEYVLESKDELVVMSDRAVDSIVDLVQLDLEDLVENGDVNNMEDALLKAFDGAKKRGKQAKDIQLPISVLYQEFKEKTGTVEYTFFTVPYIEWK